MTIPRIADYPLPAAADFPANRTRWQVAPDRAVLLIHDMQRYFVEFYAPDSALIAGVMENLLRLRRWADAHGVPVVYTAQPVEQPAADRALLNDMWGPGLTTADPALAEVIAPLAPRAQDVVLAKWRYSAFKRSDLGERMTTWGRDQLVIGGIYAHIGCLATALEAFMSDIQPFLVGDAVADFSAEDHAMALRYVATRCGSVVRTEALAGAPPRPELNRAWLEARIRALVEDDGEIDPDETLVMYGLESIAVMKLVRELTDLGVALSFEDLAKQPTLSAWWVLIEHRRRIAA